MQQPRRPIDEVVKAIVDLCDLAIPKLPYYREQEQNHYAYFSKEGAAALKAMLCSMPPHRCLTGIK